MKCYHHHDKDAVGSCKHCFKAGCPDCLTEVHQQLSCNNENCKQEVDEYDRLFVISKRIYGIGKYKKYIILTYLKYFMLMLFLTFLLGSAGEYNDQKASWIVTFGMALIFITVFFGLSFYQKRTSRR